jgi:hypothetical protein
MMRVILSQEEWTVTRWLLASLVYEVEQHLLGEADPPEQILQTLAQLLEHVPPAIQPLVASLREHPPEQQPASAYPGVLPSGEVGPPPQIFEPSCQVRVQWPETSLQPAGVWEVVLRTEGNASCALRLVPESGPGEHCPCSDLEVSLDLSTEGEMSHARTNGV